MKRDATFPKLRKWSLTIKLFTIISNVISRILVREVLPLWRYIYIYKRLIHMVLFCFVWKESLVLRNLRNKVWWTMILYIYIYIERERRKTWRGDCFLTRGLGSWRTRGDNPNYFIIENGQNTEKSPGDLKRLDVTQTPVKDHKLTLMWKTSNNNKHNMKPENDGDNCNWCSWNDLLRTYKRAGWLRYQRISRDHPEYSISKISKKIETSPGDIRKLAFTQTPVKNHQLSLVWKALKGILKNNNND